MKPLTHTVSRYPRMILESDEVKTTSGTRRERGPASAIPPICSCRLPHDRAGAQTVRREQDDPGAPDMLLRAVPIGYDRCQSPAIGSLDVHHDPFAHPQDSHACEPPGILKGTRSLGRHHYVPPAVDARRDIARCWDMSLNDPKADISLLSIAPHCTFAELLLERLGDFAGVLHRPLGLHARWPPLSSPIRPWRNSIAT
jgi:hypothetical protein